MSKVLNFIIYNVFESEDCFGGDYDAVALTLDGKLLKTFGDYYHDKGEERAEAYAKGYARALDLDLTYEFDEIAADPFDEESIKNAVEKLGVK